MMCHYLIIVAVNRVFLDMVIVLFLWLTFADNYSVNKIDFRVIMLFCETEAVSNFILLKFMVQFHNESWTINAKSYIRRYINFLKYDSLKA